MFVLFCKRIIEEDIDLEIILPVESCCFMFDQSNKRSYMDNDNENEFLLERLKYSLSINYKFVSLA